MNLAHTSLTATAPRTHNMASTHASAGKPQVISTQIPSTDSSRGITHFTPQTTTLTSKHTYMHAHTHTPVCTCFLHISLVALFINHTHKETMAQTSSSTKQYTLPYCTTQSNPWTSSKSATVAKALPFCPTRSCKKHCVCLTRFSVTFFSPAEPRINVPRMQQQSENPWAGLHDNVPADLQPRWQKVCRSRATQPRCSNVPDWVTTSATQPTFWEWQF